MINALPDLFFYLFATVLLLSAVMVIASRNPVHSVLFLILAFFNAAGLFLLLGAEFVAFILVIVYVGAVAVLFLFVVMMLDIDFEELRKGVWKSLPVGLLVGVVLIAQMVMTAWHWQALPKANEMIASPATIIERNVDGTVQRIGLGIQTQERKDINKMIDQVLGQNALSASDPLKSMALSNTQQIGQILYTDYVYPFQVAGLILLVAMIGAIVLTLRDRGGVLRQDIGKQITRKRSDVLEIRKVQKGTGI